MIDDVESELVINEEATLRGVPRGCRAGRRPGCGAGPRGEQAFGVVVVDFARVAALKVDRDEFEAQ